MNNPIGDRKWSSRSGKRHAGRADLAARKSALDHAKHWSCSSHRLHRFRARDNGVQQINGPLEFSQGLHRADVRSRASMALIGHGKQGPAFGGISFPKLMP